MASKNRVFISFDYHNDKGCKIMLAGQAKLPDSPFDFTDASVDEHLTGDWKDKVKRRVLRGQARILSDESPARDAGQGELGL